MFYRVTRQTILIGLTLLSLGVSVKAEDNTAEDDTAEEFPLIADELGEGRQVWLQNCQTCHAYGIAGAPIPKIPSQWEERLQSPLSQLYQHAIEGFYGESDTHMPARGGNPALSDAEVTAAVDYMVALATYYLLTKKD